MTRAAPPSVALAAVLALSLAGPAAAQPRGPAAAPADPDARIERELAGIRSALAEIVEVLQRQLDVSRDDVLLRRIEIKNARLVPVENELRSIRNQIGGQQIELEQLEARLQELEETAFYSEDEDAKRAARAEVNELEPYARRLRDAISVAQAQELEAQRRVDTLEAEIATLEEQLDRSRR